MTKTLRAAAALVSLAALTAPAIASAQPYPYDSREYQDRRAYDENGRPYDRDVSPREARAEREDYDERCRRDKTSSGNKGTVAGALVGGASGALIGGNLVGGLVGAGVGAVAGHQIAKSREHC